jgi:hypothetical protein
MSEAFKIRAVLPLIALWMTILPAAQSAPQTPAGLTVVLLLDFTASVSRVPVLIDQRFAQAFNAFLDGLKPSDRGAVGVIAAETRFSRVSAERRVLAADVRILFQLPDGDRLGPSALWDAIDDAIDIAAADTAGRPAVILMSDGKSTGNVHGLDEVIAHAKRSRVSVNAVLEGPSSTFLARTTEQLDPSELVGRLTDAAGGVRMLDRPSDPRQRNPGPLIASIMERLHSRAQ